MKIYYVPAFLLIVLVVVAGVYLRISGMALFYTVSILTLLVLPVPIYLVYRSLEEKVYALEERNEEVLGRLSGDKREVTFENCRTGEERMLLKKFAFVSQVSARRYNLSIFDKTEPLLGVRDDGSGDVEILVTTGSLATQSHEYIVIDSAIADLLLLEHHRCMRNSAGYLGGIISTLFLFVKIKTILNVCSIERSFELDDVDYLIQFE
ncbi:hypothetical protein [Vibrio owensii]|uniref:hypothetical protein n=1 Tax=Vibrio owensii TaxID=696485 RepID=UPI0018F233CA|nr:hypothetical protein [Vibrio owensii]